MHEQTNCEDKVFGSRAKFTVTLLVVVCIALYLGIVYVQQRIPRFSEHSLTLNSSRTYREVDIPFRLQQGLIHVHAKFAGQDADCIVDTGYASILCPQNFLSEGIRTWCQATVKDNSGRTVPVKQIVVKEVKLGGYELYEMPVFQLDEITKKQNSPKLIGVARRYPLLGNSVFAHVILTIDYRRKLLIVRQKQYDFTQAHMNNNDKTLNFCWSETLPNDCGLIEVAGEVRSVPLHFLFDTGYTGNVLGISELAANTKLTKAGRLPYYGFDVVNAGLGSMRARYAKSVTWSLQNNASGSSDAMKKTSPAVLLPNLGTASDAIVGPSLLHSDCITIDYPRKKILLASR